MTFSLSKGESVLRGLAEVGAEMGLGQACAAVRLKIRFSKSAYRAWAKYATRASIRQSTRRCQDNFPNGYFWAGVAVSAELFGAGHGGRSVAE